MTHILINIDGIQVSVYCNKTEKPTYGIFLNNKKDKYGLPVTLKKLNEEDSEKVILTILEASVIFDNSMESLEKYITENLPQICYQSH